MEQQINIKKELKSEKFNFEFDNSDVKLLLSENETKKIDAIKSLGLDAEIKKFTKQMGQNLEKKRLEKKYGANIFHNNDIKSLCFKYDLRFLSSDNYKGKFKPFLIDKVLEFTEKHKIALNGTYVDNDFKILDIRENFKNNYSVGIRFHTFFNGKNNNEPFLFYYVGENYYKLIYSDDSFISPFRFLKAWKRKSLENRNFYFVFMISLFILPLFGLLGVNLWISAPVTVIMSILISLMLMPWSSDKYDHEHMFFTKNSWNNNNKY